MYYFGGVNRYDSKVIVNSYDYLKVHFFNPNYVCFYYKRMLYPVEDFHIII